MKKLLAFLISIYSCNMLAQNPQSLRSDITIQKIISVQDDCRRIAQDPSTGKVYYIRANGTINEVDVENKTVKMAYLGAMTHATSFDGGGGFTIANDGTFFIVCDPRDATYDHGLIIRGKMDNGIRVWDTVAVTEPYLIPGGRDHRFNGIIVTRDQKYLIVNSGSRSDHGEEPVNGGREYPITSAMFKIPINSKNLILYNNEDSLKPYLYVDGVRNSFDLAYTSSGDLIATENGDTRDDTEELNWIREGRNYGFPWRIGTLDNAQQFPDYDPNKDPLLGPSNIESTFHNDPDFPPKPDSIVFTDPILNVGPDDDKFRDTDKVVKDASDLGLKLGTFTPHSSPLALVFDTSFALSSDFAGDGFFMGYSGHSAKKSAPFNEPGEDLFHIKLNKIEAEDRYEVEVTRIAQGFSGPVDAVLIGNKIYAIETGSGSSIWEITLPSNTTSVKNVNKNPLQFSLEQNYPNPFNPVTKIKFTIPAGSLHLHLTLKVYDVLGNEIATLVNEQKPSGSYAVEFNGSNFASGLYLYRLAAGNFSSTKKMIILK
jgi:Secretion system C-terminal sorting domain/Glucose / Sorbosone dehydrogenase